MFISDSLQKLKQKLKSSLKENQEKLIKQVKQTIQTI